MLALGAFLFLSYLLLSYQMELDYICTFRKIGHITRLCIFLIMKLLML
ncbi:Interleukin-1 receptor-associated kinase 1-binding protein 1, partial [Bienertia sinuspersici]